MRPRSRSADVHHPRCPQQEQLRKATLARVHQVEPALLG